MWGQRSALFEEDVFIYLQKLFLWGDKKGGGDKRERERMGNRERERERQRKSKKQTSKTSRATARASKTAPFQPFVQSFSIVFFCMYLMRAILRTNLKTDFNRSNEEQLNNALSLHSRLSQRYLSHFSTQSQLSPTKISHLSSQTNGWHSERRFRTSRMRLSFLDDEPLYDFIDNKTLRTHLKADFPVQRTAEQRTG